LVLESQSIPSRIRVEGSAVGLEIDPQRVEASQAVISTFLRENPANAKAQVPIDTGKNDADPFASSAGLAFGVGIVAVHAVSGGWSDSPALFERASADAAAIADGEWWRCVTALWLHADWRHVLGNALIGSYLVAAVCGVWGAGFGLALVLASGTLGNAINAAAHLSGHHSVGASTAVFGCIGLLAGLAARRQQGIRRSWLPLAAGLGLLGMLGTSGARVDLWAHLFGLLAGCAIGALFGRPLRPARVAQALAGIAAGVFTWACWSEVLGAI
jgi:membrane associated rhomboid family serine protease